MISAWCVAHDLHTIAPRPLERTCWKQFAALWGDCKKSRIAPLNAIIIMPKAGQDSPLNTILKSLIWFSQDLRPGLHAFKPFISTIRPLKQLNNKGIHTWIKHKTQQHTFKNSRNVSVFSRYRKQSTLMASKLVLRAAMTAWCLPMPSSALERTLMYLTSFTTLAVCSTNSSNDMGENSSMVSMSLAENRNLLACVPAKMNK